MSIDDSGAGGLRFKSLSGQIKQVLPMVSHFYHISLKGAVLLECNDLEMDVTNLLWRSTASIMKDLM